MLVVVEGGIWLLLSGLCFENHLSDVTVFPVSVSRPRVLQVERQRCFAFSVRVLAAVGDLHVTLSSVVLPKEVMAGKAISLLALATSSQLNSNYMPGALCIYYDMKSRNVKNTRDFYSNFALICYQSTHFVGVCSDCTRMTCRSRVTKNLMPVMP